MNRSNYPVILVFAFLAVTTALPDGMAEDFGILEGVEYISCYDGDTCRFNISGVHPIIGKNISVRLDGIDTPEIRGKCHYEKQMALKAKQFVNDFFKRLKPGDTINLINLKRGKYFRLVATIQVQIREKNQAINLNKLLVEKGYAVPYSGKTKVHHWCDAELDLPVEAASSLLISP